MYSSTSCSFMF